LGKLLLLPATVFCFYAANKSSRVRNSSDELSKDSTLTEGEGSGEGEIYLTFLPGWPSEKNKKIFTFFFAPQKKTKEKQLYILN
jgi:hypothetical protein